MQNNLTAIEILGLAIRSEEDAANFYGHVAKQIKNDIVKMKFLDLAREESAHRKILVDMFKKLTGSGILPKRIPGSPDTAEKGEGPVEITEIEKLLEMAIAREQKACAFYKDAAGRVCDVGGKKILEYLSSIEYGHEQLLRAELETFRKDKSWYADNPDVLLVGP
jgi:rubrerythrin